MTSKPHTVIIDDGQRISRLPAGFCLVRFDLDSNGRDSRLKKNNQPQPAAYQHLHTCSNEMMR